MNQLDTAKRIQGHHDMILNNGKQCVFYFAFNLSTYWFLFRIWLKLILKSFKFAKKDHINIPQIRFQCSL